MRPLAALMVLLAIADPLPKLGSQSAIVRDLVAEAAPYRDAPETLPEAPDYAARVAGPVDAAALVEVLTQKAHRDPFVDAYVRWQLSSLPESDLGALEPATFARLVREAPALAPCPRADPELVALFERVEQAGPLSAPDLERMQALVDRLDADAERAEAVNRPAAGFCAWVQDQLAGDPLRRRQWLLVRLAITAAAGWPVAELKREVTETLGPGEDGDAGDALTEPARALLVRQLRAMAGIERRAIDEVTFMADGSVRVTFTIGRITAGDVERWSEKLAG